MLTDQSYITVSRGRGGREPERKRGREGGRERKGEKCHVTVHAWMTTDNSSVTILCRSRGLQCLAVPAGCSDGSLAANKQHLAVTQMFVSPCVCVLSEELLRLCPSVADHRCFQPIHCKSHARLQTLSRPRAISLSGHDSHLHFDLYRLTRCRSWGAMS